MPEKSQRRCSNFYIFQTMRIFDLFPGLFSLVTEGATIYLNNFGQLSSKLYINDAGETEYREMTTCLTQDL